MTFGFDKDVLLEAKGAFMIDHYQAPEYVDAPQINEAPIPASKELRLANHIVDLVVVNVLVFGVGLVSALLAGANEEAGSDLQVIVLSLAVPLIYYVIFEALWGRTIGKLLTGTRVVNEWGAPATLGQVVGRSFGRLIPFEAFSFLGKTGRGWHDSLSRTFVVKI